MIELDGRTLHAESELDKINNLDIGYTAAIHATAFGGSATVVGWGVIFESDSTKSQVVGAGLLAAGFGLAIISRAIVSRADTRADDRYTAGKSAKFKSLQR